MVDLKKTPYWEQLADLASFIRKWYGCDESRVNEMSDEAAQLAYKHKSPWFTRALCDIGDELVKGETLERTE